MAQNRAPPAFQEYAASMMACASYRVLSLEARGLLFTLRLECWVNGGLPSDESTLARVLGVPVEQISRSLPELWFFFVVTGGQIRCPELDDYRRHLEELRHKQSAGGRVGAAKTNSTRTGKPAGNPRGRRESLVQQSQDQNSQIQASELGASHAEWKNDYERASKGH